MSKKGYRVVLLVLTVVLIVTGFNYIKATGEKELIEKTLQAKDRELKEVSNTMSVNDKIHAEQVENFKNQLKDYELILNRWTAYGLDQVIGRDLFKKTYEVDAMIYTNDSSFPVPSNGVVKTDSDEVEVVIKYSIPPQLSEKELNYFVHLYDDVFEDIKYDDPDDLTIEEGLIRIKYKDLKKGSRRNIFLNSELQFLMSLTDVRIQIVNTDDFEVSKEYRPMNVKEKKFNGGVLERGFIHRFTYLEDGSWVLEVDELLRDFIMTANYDEALKIKFEYDEELKASGLSYTDIEYTPFDKLVLPAELKVGMTWFDNDYMAMITAADLNIKTGYGQLDTVEVTYSTLEGIESYRVYYAKNLGMVYRSYRTGQDDLYDVTYFD